VHFSTWLRKRIMEAQITQRELAEQLQKSPATVSNWLAERHTPTDPDDIVNIAMFFSPTPEKIGHVLLDLMLSMQYTVQNSIVHDNEPADRDYDAEDIALYGDPSEPPTSSQGAVWVDPESGEPRYN
jgi:transcriptional regulator with XRE-family HTH domain